MKAFVVEKIGEREFTTEIKELPIPKCKENEIVRGFKRYSNKRS